MTDFDFKVPPFAHQLECWEKSRDLRFFAILWEQGVAKSKLLIDTAAWLYKRGEIDGVLIVAPNGVHRNWFDDQLPEHVPDSVREDSLFTMYDSSRHQNLEHERLCRRALTFDGLVWLMISYDAFMTGPVKTSRNKGTKKWMGGKKFVWEFLKRRQTMYALDESIEIKSPGAKKTKSIVASGVYGKYTRILNGTPIANGPFDLYPQMRFLDPNFWKDRGFGTLTEFKQHFGVWVEGRRPKGQTSKQGPSWDLGDLVGYRRLEELNQLLTPVSSRLLKKDVLDLPPKLYDKRYFEMNAEQRRVYEAIRDEAMAFLDDGGLVTAPLPITQLLRARQILSGYVPTDDEEPVRLLGKTNPRLELQLEECARTPHKGIIWCNFRMDVELLISRLGRSAVRYDGSINGDQKAENKHLFKTDPRVQWIVANETSMSKGHTLTEAHTVYYYNNSFNFIDRVQSEDRCHRAGLTHPVLYVDLIGDAVDNKILAALRKKMRTSNKITGDEEKEWI